MELIFEKSVAGRRGVRLPASDVPKAAPLPAELTRSEAAGLPEVSELELVRHFTVLSRRTRPRSRPSCSGCCNPPAAVACAFANTSP